jgi:peroxiredoxin
MALTYTPQGEPGAPCPDFTLPAVDGKTFTLKDFDQAQVLLVAFICNHCPYVKAIEDRVLTLAREYGPAQLQVAAICSNDAAEFPEDSPAELKKRWQEKKYPFPYLIDEAQDVARAFGAVCTPDFYLYGPGRRLIYRGRLDDSWKNPRLVRRRELKEAVDAALAGKSLNSLQNPSMGCSIKWKNNG